MSLPARLLLAIFAALCGIMMLAWASQADPGKAWFSYLFGGFCFAIGLVCFLRGRAAHFVGGLLAAGVVAAGVAYLAGMFLHGPLVTRRQSDTSVFNAILFLVVFGLPAVRYLRATKFGFAPPPKALSEQLSVEFDDLQVRIRALADTDERWNQTFEWSDIVRVCFMDEGIYQSDLLFIELRGKPEPIIVPTEASGGSALFDALTAHGVFPEDVWRKAMGETGGRVHCWPPHDEATSH
jgi:hypothetical protein